MNVKLGPKITLPTKFGDFEIRHMAVSNSEDLMREGVLIEQKGNENESYIVRIQSSCLFSESFWSTDFDCALQLQESLKQIKERGGLLLYFYEEGRGAGLANKIKAIELQQVNKLDTKAAYQCLKLRVDERSYEAAAAVLKSIVGDKPIILLTNNPNKSGGLLNNGINVERVESLVVGTEVPAILEYLREKRQVLGHNINFK